MICPSCHSEQIITRDFQLPGLNRRSLTYSCGHTITKKILLASEVNLTNQKGQGMYKFQQVGVAWADNNDGRVGIFDEMGLGKTVQSLALIQSNSKYCPTLIIVKSGLRLQWMKSLVDWCGAEYIPQIIENEKEEAIPGVKVFIVSIDFLCFSYNVKQTKNGTYKPTRRGVEDVEALIKRLNIQTVILDECQGIKNWDSKRTQAVVKISKLVPYFVALSGTPIKNRVSEYYSVLHCLRPDWTGSYNNFERRWVNSYFNGYKTVQAGLKNPDLFRTETQKFIIRRTREEVLPDLPRVTRNPMFCELGKEVEMAYKKVWQEFDAYFNSSQSKTDKAIIRESNLLAYFAKMRHLTGIAKTQPTTEYVTDFMAETDRKICIFVHHKDVGQALKAQLIRAATDTDINFGDEILELTSEMNSYDRQRAINRFAMDRYRILVASTQAAGEGLNIQFCSDFILMERQWNPANEEQAEGRFIRIGQLASKVTGVYMIAVGTIDEFFNELVESKRALMSSVLDGKDYDWTQTSLIEELAEVLSQKGGKKWRW